MATKVCDNCGGRGYFELSKKVGKQEFHDVIELCSVCKGRGTVEVDDPPKDKEE